MDDERRGGFRKRRGGFRQSGPREVHKATCADCGEETEVPFKPSGDRPVYCQECYQKGSVSDFVETSII